MKLISPFKSLLQGGVILNFKIAAAGSGENVQLDILPQGKDSSTGVSLPPKALVGTPEEIDSQLEEYLQKYATSVTRVAEVVANADAELKKIEDEAAAAAKKAIEDKAKNKTSTTKSPGKPGTTGTRKGDPKAGLLDDGDDENQDGDTSTTLITTGGTTSGEKSGGGEPAGGTPSEPAAAPAAQGEGVSPDLFNV